MQRFTPVLALIACCMGFDAGATTPAPGDLQDLLRTSRWEPAPQSPLISTPQLRIAVVHAAWRGRSLTMLVLREPSDRVLAVVSRAPGFPSGQSAYEWYPTQAGRCPASAVDLATIEHLYRLAINGVVADDQRFARTDGEPAASGPVQTHAELLASIAEIRECIAGALTAKGVVAPRPWRTVSLEPARTEGEKTVVAARLRAAGRPIAGATVLFTREPHLECAATTDSEGLATCKLEDTHGHEGHPDVPGIPTLSSYPGEIRSDVIVLPTTAVERRAFR